LKLTAVQEDYIEAVYRLEQANAPGDVRVKDIAELLGTRLPTVSRTVRKLTGMGLFVHAARGAVGLTPEGRQVAKAVVHRHEDLLRFFTDILGVSGQTARDDACQVEHGLSAETAQRLHEFLLFVDCIDKPERQWLRRFLKQGAREERAFDDLPDNKTTGWRT
jgi:DtxR family transcriptional regulator, Mn-dependent transcriptional regulator